MRLNCKPIAIVTGGLGLLGSQHVIALCEIGYKVYIFDNDREKSSQFYKLLHSEGICSDDFEYFEVILFMKIRLKRLLVMFLNRLEKLISY